MSKTRPDRYCSFSDRYHAYGLECGLKDRKHYTAEEKVRILRRHLLDKVPISELCEELGLQPTVFYRWHQNAASAPAPRSPTPSRSSVSPTRLRFPQSARDGSGGA